MAATDERAIHEFPTGTIDDNSLLIMDRPTSTPGEYETEKFAIANLGLKLLGGIDFPSNLDTDEQDIFGAINEVNAKAMNISEEYDETASYSKGDYCIYQNTAYRCIKDPGTTTGTFVAADWTQIKVLAEVKANTEEISEKQDKIPDTVAKTVTFDVTPSGGEVKAKLYNRVLYVSGYFRFSANQSANTQLLHVSDVFLAMDVFESCYTDGSATVRFKFTQDGKLINENQLQANQWVSISLACLIA